MDSKRFRRNRIWGFQRFRFMAAAACVSIFAQILLVSFFTVSANSYQKTITQDTTSSLFHQVSAQVLDLMKSADMLLQYARSTEISDFARSYMNLKSASIVAEKTESINQMIASLSLQPGLFDSLIVIGSNQNQKGLLYHLSTKTPVPGELPNLDELSNAGLLNLFFPNQNYAFFPDPEEWNHQLEASRNKLSADTYEKLQVFVRTLQGHLIFAALDNQVLTILTLSPTFAQMVLAESDHDGVLTIENSHQPVADDHIQNGLEPTEGMLKDEVVLSPYGLRLEYTHKPKPSDTASVYWTIYASTLISLVLSFVMAHVFASYISRPITELSASIRRSSLSLPLKPITETSRSMNRLTRVSTKRKVTMMFVFAVILPALGSGLFNSYTMNTLSNRLLEKSLEQIGDQLAVGVAERRTSYEQNVSQMASQVTSSTLTNMIRQLGNDTDRRELDRLFAAGNSLGSLDAAYFVIADSTGKAVYASMYAGNLEMFSLSRESLDHINQRVEKATEPRDMFWTYALPDIHQNESPVLVKKLNAEGNSLYLIAYLKPSSLDQLGMGSPFIQYLVSDSNDDVFRSASQADYSQAAHSILLGKDTLHILNREQLLYKRQIPETTWQLSVFMPLDMYGKAGTELLWKSMVTAASLSLALFALALAMSQLLTKPMDQLSRGMEHASDVPVPASQAIADRVDEIGILATSYNRMINRINELMERERRLSSLKSQAELRMLQHQINPHFLYNTLEGIRMRCMKYGANDISDMVDALSRLFRFSVGSESDVVPLSHEIDHAQQYIRIQQMRFPNKFEVVWEIDESLLPIKVLRFILQPIIENAIQYGLADYPTGGQLRIEANHHGDHMRIGIQDNGIGISEDKVAAIEQSFLSLSTIQLEEHFESDKKGGIGLINVQGRLKLYYGESAGIRFESKPFKGTRVEITIPIKT